MPTEARRCELWRLQGVERFADGTFDATLAGGKHNLTDVAACIGVGQMRRLDEFTARRRALARRYFERFDRSLGCELPVEDFEHSNWHMFQIVLPDHIERGDYIRAMHAAGIGIGVHYPAIHLLSLYRDMGFSPGDFPHAERIGRSIATLPLFPAMHEQDVDRVLAAPGPALAAIDADRAHEAPRSSRAGASDHSPSSYNEEQVLPALFGGFYPALDALRPQLRNRIRQRRQPRPLVALLPRSFERRPDVTRVVSFAANFGQHRAILAGFAQSRGAAT